MKIWSAISILGVATQTAVILWRALANKFLFAPCKRPRFRRTCLIAETNKALIVELYSQRRTLKSLQRSTEDADGNRNNPRIWGAIQI